jgi:hypothetical protein
MTEPRQAEMAFAGWGDRLGAMYQNDGVWVLIWINRLFPAPAQMLAEPASTWEQRTRRGGMPFSDGFYYGMEGVAFRDPASGASPPASV